MKTKQMLSTGGVDESFPQLAVLPAAQAIRQIAQSLGSSTYKRQALVQALGYSSISGAASKKVAALVHFGLLLRHGHQYMLTDLGRSIATTDNEIVKVGLYREVFKKSYLFDTIFNRFQGLPVPEGLAKILVVEYGLSPRVAEEMALAFHESLEAAEWLTGNIVGGEAQPAVEMLQSTNQPVQRVVLPSGIVLEIPRHLTYALALGQFREAIQSLESAAKA